MDLTLCGQAHRSPCKSEATGDGYGSFSFERRKSSSETPRRRKEHPNHSHLLSRLWQKPMRAHGEVAEKLGDILGQHHDLEVFRKQLREHELGKASAQDLLIGLARQRQKALEKEAFSIGAKLLAEPAKNLTRRWRSYWNSWRGNGSDEEALAA